MSILHVYKTCIMHARSFCTKIIAKEVILKIKTFKNVTNTFRFIKIRSWNFPVGEIIQHIPRKFHINQSLNLNLSSSTIAHLRPNTSAIKGI